MERKGMKQDEGKKKKSTLKLAFELEETKKFSTGLISLDQALNGGFVVGSIVEIFGEESEGKTTLGIQMLARAQAEGMHTLYLDAEHATTPEYLGEFLDRKKLYYDRPASGEETFDKVREFWEKYGHEDNMILIDSVSALIPEKQVESGESHFGAVALLLSLNLPSILRGYGKSVLIFTNQVRDKMNSWGGGVDTTGGWALKFYAGHRIKVDTIKLITNEKKTPIGKQIKVEVVKNKFGAPFRTCTLDFVFGKGFSPESDMYEFAASNKIIDVQGAGWIRFESLTIQGRTAFIEKMKENNELFLRIRDKCRVLINGGTDDGSESKSSGAVNVEDGGNENG